MTKHITPPFHRIFSIFLFIGLAFWSCEDSGPDNNDNLSNEDDLTFEGFWRVDSGLTSNGDWSERSNIFVSVQSELWTWHFLDTQDNCYSKLGGDYMFTFDTLNDSTFSVILHPNEYDIYGRTDIYRFEGSEKFVLIQKNERRYIYGRIELMDFEPICEQ